MIGVALRRARDCGGHHKLRTTHYDYGPLAIGVRRLYGTMSEDVSIEREHPLALELYSLRQAVAHFQVREYLTPYETMVFYILIIGPRIG